jgi:acyl-CoA dehydrogenase
VEDGRRRQQGGEEGDCDDQGRRAHDGLPGDRAGVCDDFQLAFFYAQARTLRFADGPDEVHRNQIARLELAEYRPPRGATPS